MMLSSDYISAPMHASLCVCVRCIDEWLMKHAAQCNLMHSRNELRFYNVCGKGLLDSDYLHAHKSKISAIYV